MQQRGWRLGIKRGVDVVGASLGLCLAAPLLAAAAVAVRATLGAPVLFAQPRTGRHGQAFTLYKLRTMRAGSASDAQRLSRLGAWLRRCSLDELPQLWHVLRGDMSLVGPRPLLPHYLPRYSAEQARRHWVLPGLTGWCQVQARNRLDWPEKLRLDVWYVDNWSLVLDARILCKTFGALWRTEQVGHGEAPTMPEFLP